MNYPQVSFYLGEFSDHPEFGELSIAPDESDVRVKKNKENYCKIKIKEVTYTTTNLELELFDKNWYLNAIFEISEFERVSHEFQDAVAQGGAILKLGELEFKSTREDNEHLFE